MRLKVNIIHLAISISLVSCNERTDSFSIDQCVGEYVCTMESQISKVLPGGRKELPEMPAINFPEGTTVTVTKTGDTELTINICDFTLKAQVDSEGKLDISNTAVFLENEYYYIPLTAKYSVQSYITSSMFYIRQEAAGTASCNYKGDKFTLPVTYTHYFDGVRKK